MNTVYALKSSNIVGSKYLISNKKVRNAPLLSMLVTIKATQIFSTSLQRSNGSRIWQTKFTN